MDTGAAAAAAAGVDLNPVKNDATSGSSTAQGDDEVNAGSFSGSSNPIESCLFFARLLTQVAPSFLFPDHETRVATFVLITSSFLTSDHQHDFITREVRSHLLFFLDYFLSSNEVFKISAEDRLPSTGANAPVTWEADKCTTLADFFDQLVLEYESSSYSDPLFTSFLLVFLQSPDPRFKVRFFSEENASCLQSMSTKADLFDARLVHRLLNHREMDVAVIEAYVKCLLSGSLRKDRNQLLYTVCTRHVNESLYTRPWLGTATAGAESPSSEDMLIQRLRLSIDRSSNESLKRDISDYSLSRLLSGREGE